MSERNDLPPEPWRESGSIFEIDDECRVILDQNEATVAYVPLEWRGDTPTEAPRVMALIALLLAAPRTARRLRAIEEAARDAETLIEGIFSDRPKPKVVEAVLERLRAALEND